MPLSALAQAACPPDTLPLIPLTPDQVGVDPAKLPIELEADQIERTKDGPVIFTGRAVATQGRRTFAGDKLVYDEAKGEVDATGNVKIRTPDGDSIDTDHLRYKVETAVGEADKSSFQIADRTRRPGKDAESVAMMGRGTAGQVKFAGHELIKLTDAAYSTCVMGQDDVFIKAQSVDLDFVSGVGTARNMRVEFMSTPIFYSPVLTFPISNKRKSGFLYPTFGGVAGSGFVFGIPYYWNIAPNMDATLTPRIMTDRGIKLDGEFRYLEHNYSGIVDAAILPSDNEYGDDRGHFSLVHNHVLTNRWRGRINYQWASDGDYYDDFSQDIGLSALTHLPQEASLNYNGQLFDFGVSLLRYQTIDDTISAAAKPHDRLPRITFNGKFPYKRGGPKFGFYGEVVNFDHDIQVSGTRVDLTPSVAWPMETIYGYLTPKASIRHTSYHSLDNIAVGADDNPSRTVGVFSVDGGLFFERDTTWGGKYFVQTLEPRLFYVYANQEAQGDLPIFDTGAVQFTNFSDFFRENQFTGADRVEDANRLTVALTSRLLDGKTGVEWMRGSVGQIYYFDDRDVTFNGVPETRDSSDILFDLNARLNSSFRVGGFMQWDTRQDDVYQGRAYVTYEGEGHRAASLSYYYTRSALDQADVRVAWPLGQRWFFDSRLLYSLRDDKALEAYGGLTYDACCWAVRIGAQRRVDNSTDYRNAILLELQLTGLAKISSGFGG